MSIVQLTLIAPAHKALTVSSALRELGGSIVDAAESAVSSIVRFTVDVPTSKALAIDNVLREHGVLLESEGPPESEAVDSDPTPPHGTPRDGGWVITEERFQQLTEAETHRDQLLGEVVKLRRRVEEMRDSNGAIRREHDQLRSRVEEMRERVAQLTVAEAYRSQLLDEVAQLRARVDEMRKQAVDGPRRLWQLGQFHRSVVGAYSWLQRELGHAESGPEVFDAASTFMDAVREAIDEHVDEFGS